MKKLISILLLVSIIVSITNSSAFATDSCIKILVEPSLEYDKIEPFQDGHALVMKNGKMGFIDKTGSEVISCIYDISYYGNMRSDKYLMTPSFVNGYMLLSKDNKSVLVDKTGAEVIPSTYDGIGNLYNGLILSRKGDKWGYIDLNKNVIIPFVYDEANNFTKDYAKIKREGKYGYIDKTGNEVLPCIYDEIDDTPADGMALAQKNGKWGFIDTETAKETVPCIYDRVEQFWSDIYAKVLKGNKWGFVDKLGNEVIPCIYDDVRYFSNDRAMVMKNSKCGLIDRAGNEIMPCIYDLVSWYGKKYVWVENNGTYSAFDIQGKEVLSFADYSHANDFADDFILVVSNGKQGLLDLKGNTVLPCAYDDIENMDLGVISSGCFSIKNEGKFGLVDKTGKIIAPCIYDSKIGTSSMNDGLLRIINDGKVGFIDLSGDVVIPCTLNKYFSFSEGLGSMELNGKDTYSGEYVYIDTKGTKISLADQYDYAGNFKNGLAHVTKDGQGWGLIDKTGKEIAPCKYNQIGDFIQGLAPIEIDGKWGRLDVSGNEVLPCIYDYIGGFSEGLAVVSKDGKWGIVENLLYDNPNGEYLYNESGAENDVPISNTEIKFSDISSKPVEMQNAINMLVTKRIVYGYNGGEFSPDTSITRAELATLLLRILGELDPKDECDFSDVSPNAWYYHVAGASKKAGIITGFEDNTFRGDDNITKDQIMVIASRILKNKLNYQIPSNVSCVLNYYDYDNIESWGRDDIALATQAGLVVKRSSNKFVPKEEMTRGDVAIIIKRLYDKIFQ